MSDDDILALGRVAGRAARAYELGRLRSALVRALGAMALTGLAFAACSFTFAAAACIGPARPGRHRQPVARGRLGARRQARFAAGLMPCFVPAVLSLDACHLPGLSLSTICLLTGVAAASWWAGAVHDNPPACRSGWLPAGSCSLSGRSAA
jgi:hypothetical protein